MILLCHVRVYLKDANDFLSVGKRMKMMKSDPPVTGRTERKVDKSKEIM